MYLYQKLISILNSFFFPEYRAKHKWYNLIHKHPSDFDTIIHLTDSKNQSSKGLNDLSEPYIEKLKSVLQPKFLTKDCVFPCITQNFVSLQISLVFCACFCTSFCRSAHGFRWQDP